MIGLLELSLMTPASEEPPSGESSQNLRGEIWFPSCFYVLFVCCVFRAQLWVFVMFCKELDSMSPLSSSSLMSLDVMS